MSPPRLAIFDFDGTIADSAGWFYGVLSELARRHGFREVSLAEREELRSRSSREILAHLGLPIWKVPLVAREARKLATRDIDQIRAFSWVPDLFETLRRRGMRIAIVSSNTETNIRHVLGAEVAALVEHYGTGASLFGKAVKLRAAMRESGVPAAGATAIGDEARDVAAARAVGIASLAVTWGYADASALRAACPTRLLDRPSEIVDWFV